jgi:lipopolysaccharide export system permease protein
VRAEAAAAGARGGASAGGVRILDRYLLREFAAYLALGLVGFISIFVVVDIIEKVDVFLDHQAPFPLVARFYLYKAPEVVVLVLPVALLLATFLALGQLNKFGELTAMRTSGQSLLRILAPVLAIAAASSIGGLLLNEFVVPPANRERDRIYDEQIQGVKRERIRERVDVTYLGRGGRIFYVRLYSVADQRMQQVSMQEYSHGTLVRRIDAEDAVWDGHQWQFHSGFIRTFKNGEEEAKPFDAMTIDDIAERPEDFAKDLPRPQEMNFFELRSYVERLRASGARVENYLVDLHLKLAFPLVNFIVVMIGASLATRLRMRGAALGFGLSVVISFLYYAFMRTGQALGHNGALPPYLAAWLGDMVFGLIAIVMLADAQRR